jgi:hypothetical protein
MLTFDLSLASAEEAGAPGLAVGSGVESWGCVCATGCGSIFAASGLASGAAGALADEAFSLSSGGETTFGSGLGAGGADSSGFAASRGAGGGRGGPTTGGTAAGGILRAVAADFGFDFVESGASGESNGLMALGMRAFVGPL